MLFQMSYRVVLESDEDLVSINHIVIQLPYILKRKTNGLSGITVFFRCECTFIAYRIINLKEIVSKIVMCFTIPFSFIFPTE